MSVPARKPRHLAIIMDGNGRWAERRHRPRTLGHRAGARAVQVCLDFCLKEGIGSLTLFAFSSENWKRPPEEVGALMKLFDGSYARAGAIITLVYVVGLFAIWFAPETKGRTLPE